jgi:polygalacturonase
MSKGRSRDGAGGRWLTRGRSRAAAAWALAALASTGAALLPGALQARDRQGNTGARGRRAVPERKQPPITAAPDPWAGVPKILARIVPPTFPARTFDVTSFGAVGDGVTDCRPAFARAIAACHAAGGGKVLVPAGAFLVKGPIHLKSNVNLHVSREATIRFSNDPSHFLPPVLVRWEGTRCYNYSPLIYAIREKNIAITGAGRIDGQATLPGSGWEKLVHTPGQPGKRREDLRSMGRALVPVEQRVFGKGSNMRPQLFHAYEVQNLLIEGVTFTGSPFWTINPAFSRNVTVRGVTVIGDRQRTLHNDDAFNPDSSQDVLVDNCTFDNVCDNVGIKAGRDNDAWGDLPTENVVIRNSLFRHGWGAIAVGSEVSGGIRNVFIENNRMVEARYGLHLKSNGFRGGTVEGVYVRNNRIGRTEECIRIESAYADVNRQSHATPFSNLRFEDLRCDQASVVGVRSEGLPNTPIVNLVFRNVTIGSAREPLHITDTKDYLFENVNINGVHLPPGIQVAGSIGTRAAR